MRVSITSLEMTSGRRVEFVDVTPRVREVIRAQSVTDGLVMVAARHTTCALFVNEFQTALTEDFTRLLGEHIPEQLGYRHDDPRYSDCERGNGAAHLRALLLGSAVTLTLAKGQLALGRFQSIIFAEFDGPRRRDLVVQILGQ